MSIAFPTRTRPTASALPNLLANWRVWVFGHALMLPLVWIVSVGWLVVRADQGWIPHDAGTIAQAAERVLQGELPHRDFDTPYTGGLEFLNALAFQLFGVRMVATRWLLLLVAAAFIPAVYALAARVAPPWAAALTTLLAVAWSLPNYFTALPSWYNLFCATFGTLALMRYIDTNRARWLVAAGLAGGVSCLFKSIGLYYLAAAGLLLVFRQQTLSAEASGGRRSKVHVAFTLAALTILAAMLVALVAYHPAAMELFHFALPGVALTSLLAMNEIGLLQRGAPARTRELSVSLGWMALGAVLPIALYLTPFIATASVEELWRGVAIAPLKRLAEAAVALPSLDAICWALPLALVLITSWLWHSPWVLDVRNRCGQRTTAQRHTKKGRPVVPVDMSLRSASYALTWLAFALVGAVLAMTLIAGGQEPVFRGVWAAARAAIPVAVIAGCLWLWREGPGHTKGSSQQELFLILAMAALVSLVQVPLAHAIYFLYAAPLAALAVLYVARRPRSSLQPVSLALLLFFLAFPLVWLQDALPHAFGKQYVQLDQTTPMDLERSGLRVDAVSAPVYRDLVAEIHRRASDSPYIFAGPDCPEVYFLAGKRNPTRTFFDVFDADYNQPQRPARILRMLDERGVNVVVQKHLVEVSRLGQQPLMAQLNQTFPHSKTYTISGQIVFTVRWRDRREPPPATLADSAPMHRLEAR